MTAETPHKSSTLTRLRNYFLTGLIITAPLIITVYLIWAIIQWVDSWVMPYVPSVYHPDTYLPFDVPGVGLIIAIFLITLVGFLTANIIGRTVVNYGEYLLGRMPFVRSLYNGLKQIFETVFASGSATFTKVGLIEYPRHGLWAIAFVATEARGEVKDKLAGHSDDTLAVFLPTTPNPTSGFLLYMARKDIIFLDMSIEDAAKLIISAGLVTPKADAKDTEGPMSLAEASKVGASAKPAPMKAKPSRKPRKAS
jgi:uncharacterized membrane protein